MKKKSGLFYLMLPLPFFIIGFLFFALLEIDTYFLYLIYSIYVTIFFVFTPTIAIRFDKNPSIKSSERLK